MKSITNWKSDLLRIPAVVVLLFGFAGWASATPIAGIEILSVSPRDVAASPSDIFDRSSTGLNVVGVGTKSYFQADPTSTTVAASYRWSIERRPWGSVAVPSPAIGDATGFVPDVEGVYHVILTPLDGAGAPYESVQQVLYVGTWVGAGVFNTWEEPDDTIPHCGNACCHAESTNPRLNVVGEWIESNHATKLQRHLSGELGDRFPVTCLPCHAVGYDLNPATNENNGFDDIARMIGFDLNLIPNMVAEAFNTGVDQWPNLPPQLQGHASIQCENCHGPGSQHMGNLLKSDHGIGGVDLSAKQCSHCHDSGTHHYRPLIWKETRHAIVDEHMAENTSCVRCHTGEGFVEVQVEGKPAVVHHDPNPITCVVCHDPHDSQYPHQLRLAGAATLPNGFVFEEPGLGGLCMRCHNGRRADGENEALRGRRGIHDGPQADMMAGQSAAAFDLMFIGNSAHSTIVEDTCVTCHMAQGDHSGIPEVGDHTFSMRDDMGTEDPSDDHLNVEAACAICHVEMTEETYDREARGDYDGDGALEGIQTEVRGLIDFLTPGIIAQLNAASAPYTLEENGVILVDTDAAYRALPEGLRRAIYNRNYVLKDGSYGIHNTSFAVQMLQRSYFGVYGRPITDDYPNVDLRGPVQPSTLPPTPTPTPWPSPTPSATPPPPSLGSIELLGASPRTVALDTTGLYDEVASGLYAIGKGEKVYMKAHPANGTVTGFTWSVKTKPTGSTATVSVFGSDIATFRPDKLGAFEIELMPLVGGTPAPPGFVQKIYSTEWAGAGVFNTHDTIPPIAPQCGTGYCHGEYAGRTELQKVKVWIKSGHAQKLQKHLSGEEGAHYAESCLPCHTVGYKTLASAVNNGFDDRAKANDYPTTLVPHLVEVAANTGVDQWPNLPKALQSHASIQCESCHGAGSLHPGNIFTRDRGIDGVNLGVKQCAQCHDSAGGYQQKVYQWTNSPHSGIVSFPAGRSNCTRCHTGEGFVNIQVLGKPEAVPETQHAITCSTCHDPHYSNKPHQLRLSGDYKLPAGIQSFGSGVGGLCLRCHNSRISDGEAEALSGRRGVHYSAQGDMLLGSTGAGFGLPFAQSSPHGVVVPELCVHCHMAAPTESGRGIITPPLVGDHTFSMRDTMGTEDHSDDVINVVNACNSCHFGLDTFDYPAGKDYDGDGAREGVQTEVKGLLALLEPGILNQLTAGAYVVEESGKILVNSDSVYRALREDLRRAIYNYNYVIEDGSFGVHNTRYAVQLLQRAYFGVYGRSIIEDFPGIVLPGPVQEPGSGPGQPNLWMAR